MIEKILEDNGFNITYDSDGCSLQQYTPAGEDWWLYFDEPEEIVEYAENYCPEDDFEIWIEAKYHGDTTGIPSVPELWKDQLWKRDLLHKIADEIKESKNDSLNEDK